MRHWNAVERALRTMDPYEPPLATGAGRGDTARDWATGYRAGVGVHATTWYAAAEQCHAASYLQDIISLASGVYAEPKLAMTLETSGFDQERETRILMLGYNATLLFRMLAPARGEPVHDMLLDPGSPADLASRWEIGLVALPVLLEEHPEGDPVMLLVVNEGGIAHSEVLADEPDAAELARFVAGEVTHCIAQLGAPPLIWCDDDLLLGALADGLGEGPEKVEEIAVAAMRQGDVPRALRLLDGVVAQRPGEPRFRMTRGRVRIQSRDCQGAFEDFDAARLAAPSSAAAHGLAGSALMCLGRPAEARRAFEQSLALDPNQPRLRELLSRDR